MYEELVKRLRTHNGWALNETLDAAADAIEYLVRLRNAAEENRLHWQKMAVEFEIAMHTAQEKLPKWIPVTERLPEEPGVYIVYIHEWEEQTRKRLNGELEEWEGYDLGYVDSAFFDKDQMIWNDGDNQYNAVLSAVDREHACHITHWMPTPGKPKEETE